MKRNFTTAFLIIITVILITASLSSCGKATNENTIKDYVSISSIENKINNTLGDMSIAKAEENYVRIMMTDIDTSYCDDFAVYLPQSGNSDQYGVFKTSSAEDAAKVKEGIEVYFDGLKEGWMEEYSPDEYTKIKNAKCVVTGNYVLFVVMDDTKQSDCINAFNDMLISK